MLRNSHDDNNLVASCVSERRVGSAECGVGRLEIVDDTVVVGGREVVWSERVSD